MWLINQDERKKFISATIEEMATPFLDKSKRPDSFYWESLFEFEIPIKILTEISKGLGDLLKDTSKVNNNVRSLINENHAVLNKVDENFIEEMKLSFFAANSIKQYTFDDFDDLIDEWHDKEDDGIPLHTFLGLTWAQYQKLFEFKKIYN